MPWEKASEARQDRQNWHWSHLRACSHSRTSPDIPRAVRLAVGCPHFGALSVPHEALFADPSSDTFLSHMHTLDATPLCDIASLTLSELAPHPCLTDDPVLQAACSLIFMSAFGPDLLSPRLRHISAFTAISSQGNHGTQRTHCSSQPAGEERTTSVCSDVVYSGCHTSPTAASGQNSPHSYRPGAEHDSSPSLGHPGQRRAPLLQKSCESIQSGHGLHHTCKPGAQ